jgi:hypothetical protein
MYPIPGDPFTSADTLFDAFDAHVTFGSEATNGEYSMLSAILGNLSPIEPHSNSNSNSTPPPPPPQLAYPHWPAAPPLNQVQNPYGRNPDPTSPYGELSIPQPSSPTYVSYPHTQYPQPLNVTVNINSRQDRQEQQHQQQLGYPAQYGIQSIQDQYSGGRTQTREDAFPGDIISPVHHSHSHSPSSTASLSIGCSGGSDLTAGPPPAGSGGRDSQIRDINDRVTAPYDYTEGYHFLMKHSLSR